MKERTGRLSRPKVIVFSLLPALVLLGLVEGAARIYWAHLERQALGQVDAVGRRMLANDAINFLKQSDPVLGYRMKANLDLEHFATTAQGFTQREPVSIAREPNSLRIVAIGESSTQGHGVDASYPTHLRRLLTGAAIYPGGVEVINAGVSGWVSDQSALWAETELAQYRPDIVFLYSGWNDFQSYSQLVPPPSESSFRRAYGVPTRFVDVGLLKSVVLGANLFAKLREKARALSAAAMSSPPYAPEEIYRFYLQNLDRIVSAFRRSNPDVKFAIATLVAPWPLASDEAYTAPNARPAWMARANLSQTQAAEMLERLNDLIRDYARNRNLLLIDLAAKFAPLDRPRMMSDFIHFHDVGYRFMANMIADDLIRAGWIKADSPAGLGEMLKPYGGANADKSRPIP